MPRRTRRDAVAERAEQTLAEQAGRRREAAQRGAQTRRQRRSGVAGQRHRQGDVQRPTRAHVERHTRQRARPEMVTIALRGPLAAKVRQLAETTGLSLAKLLGDMALVYEGETQSGYQPGTRLARWREQAG